MSRWRAWRVRWRDLLRPRRVERELDEELRFHLEMEAAAQRASGLPDAEARRRARLRFGGVEGFKEASREARGFSAWSDAARDLRLTVRQLAARPGFALAAILSLAVGIGADTAIFSALEAVLLRPSPFAEPDRLVMLWETDRASDTRHEPASWPDLEDFRRDARSLAGIEAFAGLDATLAGADEPVRITGLLVTPGLPRLLGVRPLAGRLFAADDGTGQEASAVLLGESLWRRRFAADPAVVGRTVTLDERPATVVGVLPAAADLGIRQVHERADYSASFGGGAVDVWVALAPTAEAYPRQTHPFLALARLAPGRGLPAAQRELAAIAARLEARFPENADRGVHLESYSEVVFGPVRRPLWVLFGAVTLVLCVMCVNVANLLLARTATRRREVAVRRALGAAGGRLRRQFLVEGLVLAGLGVLSGLGLAAALLRALVAAAPADVPRLGGATLDGTVLAYAVAIGGGVAVALGLLPALEIRRLDPLPGLRSTPRGRGAASRRGGRFRGALVVAEVALAVVLVIGAGLLLRSFWRLRQVDPGFHAAGVLKVQYELPETRYPRDFSRWPDLPEITGFHARLLERVRALPGVAAAAVAGGHPLDPGFTNSFVIVGREAESADFPEIRTRFLSPGYLDTLGVDLVAGRDLRAADDAHAPAVLLINRAAARRYFPGRDPLGQRIAFWGTERRIVGVIGDERFAGLDRPAAPAAYAPLAQAPPRTATLLLRLRRGDPRAAAPAVRRVFAALDPGVVPFAVEPLTATLAASLAPARFTAVLLGLFAAVALLLALIGVHGVLAYGVAERVPEVGLRMALGATRADVMAAILGRGLTLAGAGVGLGLVAAAAGSRLLASLVYGVTATDPATFLAAPAAILAAALVASALPAVRAVRTDPGRSLRAE